MTDQMLDILWSEREIGRHLTNFCRGMDRMDRDLILPMFHEDAILNYNVPGYDAKAHDLVDKIIDSHRIFEAFSHQITNVTIEIRGNLAVSEAYARHTLRMPPDRDGQITDMHANGRYLDKWERRNGHWGIYHRTLIRDVMSRHIVQDFASGGETGKADRTDATYALFEPFLSDTSPGELAT